MGEFFFDDRICLFLATRIVTSTEQAPRVRGTSPCVGNFTRTFILQALRGRVVVRKGLRLLEKLVIDITLFFL